MSSNRDVSFSTCFSTWARTASDGGKSRNVIWNDMGTSIWLNRESQSPASKSSSSITRRGVAREMHWKNTHEDQTNQEGRSCLGNGKSQGEGRDRDGRGRGGRRRRRRDGRTARRPHR